MKRLVLAVLAVLAATSLSSYAAPLTDLHGNVHYKGYVGHKAKLIAEPTWTPTADQVAALPDNYDLRTLGFVAPVRDQGQCGSCWAHSLVKTFESSRLLHGSAYLDLSEQDEMMNGDGDNCNGGTMDGAHMVNHGSTLETNCPYVARANACSAAPVDHGASWAFIGANTNPTVDDLRAAIVAHGVISVTVAAGGVDWQGGNAGRMTDCSNTGVDHMVNLIGYRKESDGTYTFIGRNSWGTGWGDKGDFYAKQGCDQLAIGGYSALYIDASGNTPPPGPTPPPPSPCTKAVPSITVAPSVGILWLGNKTANFTATIKNNNSPGCGTSSVGITAKAPVGIGAQVNPPTISPAPGASATVSIPVSLNASLPRGYSYVLSLTATDSVSRLSAATSAKLFVLNNQGK